MKRDGDRKDKMEGHCSTGQSPQRAVAPMEEEEEAEEEEKEEEELQNNSTSAGNFYVL